MSGRHWGKRSLHDRVVILNALAANCNTLLNANMLNGRIELARALLDNGARINMHDNSGFTLLFIAVFCKNIEMIKLLLERGADINQRTLDGWNVFHAFAAGDCADENTNRAILRMLLYPDRAAEHARAAGSDRAVLSSSNTTSSHSADSTTVISDAVDTFGIVDESPLPTLEEVVVGSTHSNLSNAHPHEMDSHCAVHCVITGTHESPI